MGKLRKLRKKRKEVNTIYDIELAKLRSRKGSPDELTQLENEYSDAVIEADIEIETFQSDELLRKARNIDARVPAFDDKDFWVFATPYHRAYLNTTGRNLMRDRITEIKKRDFDDWAKWILLLTPFMAGLAGILGVITGLVAVLLHKK
jgi:hypothetical protein